MTTTGDLYQAWYDAVVQAFGLSPLSFLMARSLIPLGSTSRDLWDYFDSVPLASDGHYYEPNLFNRFSDGYGAMVNVIIPQAGMAWREAVGDHYGQWVEYLSSNPPIPPGGMLELFTVWAEKNIPDPARAQQAITAYSQILNGAVPVAQDRFITAKGVYAYSLSIDEARALARQGLRYELSFASDGMAPASLPAVAGLLGTAQAKLAASHVEGKALFDHQARVWAAPLQTREIVGSLPYPPWFSGTALDYAYNNPDNTVWPVDLKPTWEQTFGPTGNLRRLVTSVILVDGVDVTLLSDADLTAGEQAALQQAAALGRTPLFDIATPAALEAAGFRAQAAPAPRLSITAVDEKIEIHIQSPPGIVMLFGVVAVKPE